MINKFIGLLVVLGINSGISASAPAEAATSTATSTAATVSGPEDCAQCLAVRYCVSQGAAEVSAWAPGGNDRCTLTLLRKRLEKEYNMIQDSFPSEHALALHSHVLSTTSSLDFLKESLKDFGADFNYRTRLCYRCHEFEVATGIKNLANYYGINLKDKKISPIALCDLYNQAQIHRRMQMNSASRSALFNELATKWKEKKAAEAAASGAALKRARTTE